VSSLRIEQPRAGYRVSMEPFLLASFTCLRKEGRGVDLGTGSGVLAVLLARRYPALQIVGIEIQEDLVTMARKNVESNGVEKQVEILRGDFRQARELWPSGSFDVAISNPPYRSAQSGRLSPDPGRALARHEVAMSLADLGEACAYLLKDHGKLFLTYHPARLAELSRVCGEKGLTIKRLQFVHARPGAQAKMVLIEAVKKGREGLQVSSPFFVYREGGNYSAEMKAVYGLDDPLIS